MNAPRNRLQWILFLAAAGTLMFACSFLADTAKEPESAATASPGWPDFEDLRAGSLGGRILHGSGPLFRPEHHDAYLAAFPDTPSIVVRADINIGGTQRFTIDEMVAQLAENFNRYPREIPLLTVNYITSERNNKTGLGREVIAGAYDEALTKLAALVRGFDQPVLIRPAAEFNGWWNGYLLEYYAESFRYIAAFFQQEGVTNAVYMWNYMPQGQAFPYMDWYPGDDVVDWWSVDVFSGHFQDAAANAELHRFLADAAARGKPVFIPESGPSTQGVADVSVWDSWFVPYFALINGDPNIKGFCYSNEDFRLTTTASDWQNVMLQDSPIRPFYAEELKKPQYWNQNPAG
ncbi:MAG: glycosyl hydrolase [Anaerolineales bacterium]